MKTPTAFLIITGLTALGGEAIAQPTPSPTPLGVIGGPPWNGVRSKVVVAPAPGMDMALKAARAAVAACPGFHIGVSIVDAAGLPKLTYIPDGTPGTHALTSFRKATTALLVKGPSEGVLEAIKADKAMAEEVTGNPDYISYAGGLPIMSGSQIIGAIGVSGAEPSAKDKACAVAAVEAIQVR